MSLDVQETPRLTGILRASPDRLGRWRRGQIKTEASHRELAERAVLPRLADHPADLRGEGVGARPGPAQHRASHVGGGRPDAAHGRSSGEVRRPKGDRDTAIDLLSIELLETGQVGTRPRRGRRREEASAAPRMAHRPHRAASDRRSSRASPRAGRPTGRRGSSPASPCGPRSRSASSRPDQRSITSSASTSSNIVEASARSHGRSAARSDAVVTGVMSPSRPIRRAISPATSMSNPASAPPGRTTWG